MVAPRQSARAALPPRRKLCLPTPLLSLFWQHLTQMVAPWQSARAALLPQAEVLVASGETFQVQGRLQGSRKSLQGPHLCTCCRCMRCCLQPRRRACSSHHLRGTASLSWPPTWRRRRSPYQVIYFLCSARLLYGCVQLVCCTFQPLPVGHRLTVVATNVAESRPLYQMGLG